MLFEIKTKFRAKKVSSDEKNETRLMPPRFMPFGGFITAEASRISIKKMM
jgi:hypothetical protein